MFFWSGKLQTSATMSLPISSASTSATPEPIIYQAPIKVPLPTYDWNVPDQMCEFRLFKCKLDIWFWLCKIKAEECLHYLLCILGKEGYTAMDCWVPTDEAHKWDLEKFFDYLESTLDDEIPQVWVYELEDIKKRSDKSVNELIDRIHQRACCVQIGNGSDATIEFEVQCRLIWTIPDANIKLQKEPPKVSHDKKVSHLPEISHTYYVIESGVAVMCAGKAIHDLSQGHQPKKNKTQKSVSQWLSCTHSHPPGCDNCPAWNAICKGCSKKGHWNAQCHTTGTASQQPAKSDGAEKAPPSSMPCKGEDSWYGTS